MLIKFVCLNLWYGGLLFDEVVDFIRHEDPDILALQEVYQSEDGTLKRHFRALQELSRVLDMPHQAFAPAFVNISQAGEKVEQGNAVFSKFPIASNSVKFYNEPYGERIEEPAYFPSTPRNLQHAEITTPAGAVNVLNTQGVWDLDGANFSPQRQRMSELMIEMAQGKPHVILAGDTNARPINPAILAVEKHLTNVFKDELTTTFNMRHKTDLPHYVPGYAKTVVDMVFVSSDIKVVAHSCPDVNVSDHLPLVATFEI